MCSVPSVATFRSSYSERNSKRHASHVPSAVSRAFALIVGP